MKIEAYLRIIATSDLDLVQKQAATLLYFLKVSGFKSEFTDDDKNWISVCADLNSVCKIMIDLGLQLGEQYTAEGGIHCSGKAIAIFGGKIPFTAMQTSMNKVLIIPNYD